MPSINSNQLSRDTEMNNRKCDVCNSDVHRASYAKHFRSEKHLEIIRQDDMIIPGWLPKEEQEPIEKKLLKTFNPKSLKQIARDTII